jgi:four helix bundle protein
MERRDQSEEESVKGNKRFERGVPVDKKGSYSFRFQNLDIWKKAVGIGMELFDIADELDRRHLHRFAEQLRAAGLSMSNNIAEGSGSYSKKEFNQFLNIARRSTFENANMIIMYQMRQLISGEQKEHLLQELDELCRMISGFVRSLRS